MRKSFRETNRLKKQKFILWCATIFITILGLVCFFVYKQHSSKNTKEVSEHIYIVQIKLILQGSIFLILAVKL